ncbi:NUDIX domain-containing protein [Terracoccus luteus]|uniref:8-oxo-dGTP diphosphatase n=1 Tax=Terracoccus luteus TaxID=53356 RepID=A0A839PX08_9MICO|nr:NUDIX domain-containing protein [Terracoccus luteus]MBB2986565.1 mutator protein MutT [Terracoccus luteus]MCP2171846.1 mutator protein MutT [Terracoccus luteus]
MPTAEPPPPPPTDAGPLVVVLGALVVDRRLLLVHRRPDKAAFPDVWDLPGGVVEAGETEREALARELREELGIRVETPHAGGPVHLGHWRVAPAGDSVLLSAWLVSRWHGTPTNAAPDEHDGLEWFALGRLPPAPHPPSRAALVQALEASEASEGRR